MAHILFGFLWPESDETESSIDIEYTEAKAFPSKEPVLLEIPHIFGKNSENQKSYSYFRHDISFLSKYFGNAYVISGFKYSLESPENVKKMKTHFLPRFQEMKWKRVPEK